MPLLAFLFEDLGWKIELHGLAVGVAVDDLRAEIEAVLDLFRLLGVWCGRGGGSGEAGEAMEGGAVAKMGE